MNIGKVIWTYGDGRKVTKVHLTPDEGKMLTRDGESFFGCVDVDSIAGWYELDAPETYEE